MKKSCDCVVGLREANVGSGVGLFNDTLARRLGIPHVHLQNYFFSRDECPLLSLKFEELSPRCRRRLLQTLTVRGPDSPYALFLHTLDQSEAETIALRGASQVLCGNDFIYQELRAREPGAPLARAFAPSLIPEGYEHTCRPAGEAFFFFGMAGKVDLDRFARLREMLDEVIDDYRLLCSLAVHQTSDGSCLPRALDFLTRCFGERLIHLGTLSDQGVAYFLNACPVFVGFYRTGVRSNNTTFNTAIRFANKIISNLDEYSPAEVRDLPHVLDIDRAGPEQLREFLHAAAPRRAAAARLFSWDDLISGHFLERPVPAAAAPRARVA